MPALENILQTHLKDAIAIYGLSPLTESLLTKLAGYQVIGLLDGCRTSGELYGKLILSMEEAFQNNVRLIIVAARPESCKVIAKRIGEICAEHTVSVVDIYGNDLCAPREAVYHFADVPGISKKQLQHLIDSHDVVSVDLFDTLIMRRTLFSTDVFEIVDLHLKQQGIVIEDFPQKRLEGEKTLAKLTVPTLVEIYTYLLEQSPVPNIQPVELAQLEWEVDEALIIPREELCALLREARRRGKPVYIVSDTFYTKKQLETLLKRQGITWYTDIFPSCGYQTGKTQHLFDILGACIKGKTCLHIGDSVDADVESPTRYGFTACQLYSGQELLEYAGYLGLWGTIQGLSSRIQAGMLAAKWFNSPFQFENSERSIHVDNAHDVGYLFFGPIVTGFIIWLQQQIQKCGIKNIWFGARDGYLIKKLYDLLNQPVRTVYFLTSRFAAVRAGVENEEDLRYLEQMRFSGSLQEELWDRFGIAVEAPDKGCVLTDYAEKILSAAAVYRRGYQRYLQNVDTTEEETAFYDFVARGTVQMYVERLAGKHLKGFYFWQQDKAYMREKNLDIQTFYGTEDNWIAHHYLVMETVLMAPHPPVLGFDENGQVHFAEETRTEKDLRCIQRVQDGISDYVQEYLKINPAWRDTSAKDLEESILSLISKVEIRDKDFLELKDEDPFFRREADISDLL